MRRPIVYFLTVVVFSLAASAGEQQVTTFQESANGDQQAELQINSKESRIVAGYRKSSKSKDYEAYWMKSNKNGNRICVEKSRRDEVTRGHYLQENADGSSLLASFESSPEKPEQFHFLLKGSSGDKQRVIEGSGSALLRKLPDLDREMNVYMKYIFRHMRTAVAIHRD